MRRAWRWLRGHPYVVSIAILAGGVILSLYIDQRQDARERAEDAADAREVAYSRVDLAESQARHDCLTANDSRQAFREIAVDLSISGAEALIAVAGPEADPATIEQYRQFVASNAAATAARLEDRNCDAEAAQAREEALDAEGLPEEEP